MNYKNSRSYDPKTGESILLTDLQEAQARLSDALLNYISAELAEACRKAGNLHCRLPSNFECLITCQFACAGKLGEKCISQSLKTKDAAPVFQGAVTFGRLLNAERNKLC